MGRAGRASGGGKRWGGLPRCQRSPTRDPRGTTVRPGQLGSGWPPTRAEDGEARGRRALARAGSATARVPGLREGRRRGGTRPRCLDRGWELRARTFRKSAGASSGASPPPPPARLPFRVVTQPAGYAEVCAETRNLPGRRRRLPAPAQPRPRRAPRSPAPAARRRATTGDALRQLNFRAVLGCGLGDERLVTFITHATVFVMGILLLASLRGGETGSKKSSYFLEVEQGRAATHIQGWPDTDIAYFSWSSRFKAFIPVSSGQVTGGTALPGTSGHSPSSTLKRGRSHSRSIPFLTDERCNPGKGRSLNPIAI
ncbi:uncharacterized protein LOC130830071 [Hippopotamus amphibius kiboko]|uniref:uncharacterized protein LOC130830071 n=1 Tax=Hippopotamus amphibius kiboko TaxID=575201 RepID=UPI0025981BB0|nr:uncharacterized protein LOC130830071 [Hippopotamus amphibius kiboko]